MKNKAEVYLDKLSDDIEALVESSTPEGIDVEFYRRRGTDGEIAINIEAEVVEGEYPSPLIVRETIIDDYHFLRDRGYTVGGSILSLLLVYSKEELNESLFTANL